MCQLIAPLPKSCLFDLHSFENFYILQTIENLRNRTNVVLVHQEEKFIKLMSKPSMQGFQRFSDDLAAVKLLQTKLKLDRPITCGMVILDLAKLLMYDYYYNVLKKRYGDQLELLFTDTDSLCVSIKTHDVYKDMEQPDFWDTLDCSGYPKNHPLYNEKNMKVIGKFKDEMDGKPIVEFVGLRAKMYSIRTVLGDMVISLMTCKGITRSVKEQLFEHQMYKDALDNVEIRRDNVCRIGSHGHVLYTYTTDKVSLSPYDDKRYILLDKKTTLAYGHYKILSGEARSM